MAAVLAPTDESGIPDPQAAHKAMVMKMDDPHNKNMHDVTAYLVKLH